MCIESNNLSLLKNLKLKPELKNPMISNALAISPIKKIFFMGDVNEVSKLAILFEDKRKINLVGGEHEFRK